MKALPDDVFAPIGNEMDGMHESLERLVFGLSPESRALLMLRTVHGWSVESIAAAWGQSPATIRRRHARIITHLRANLELEEEHV